MTTQFSHYTEPEVIVCDHRRQVVIGLGSAGADELAYLGITSVESLDGTPGHTGIKLTQDELGGLIDHLVELHVTMGTQVDDALNTSRRVSTNSDTLLGPQNVDDEEYGQ